MKKTKTITHRNKNFSLDNGVWLRGSLVGTITEINENEQEKEVNLTILTNRHRTIMITLWKNKVFINSRYRGKLEHLLGDEAQEVFSS